jgi:hypothetical protein
MQNQWYEKHDAMREGAQLELFDEKPRGRKSRDTVPLIAISNPKTAGKFLFC